MILQLIFITRPCCTSDILYSTLSILHPRDSNSFQQPSEFHSRTYAPKKALLSKGPTLVILEFDNSNLLTCVAKLGNCLSGLLPLLLVKRKFSSTAWHCCCLIRQVIVTYFSLNTPKPNNHRPLEIYWMKFKWVSHNNAF